MITAKLSKTAMEEKGLPSRRVVVDEVVHETQKAILALAHPVADEADNCHRCGREITNPVSRMIGYGPDCAEKIGYPLPIDPDMADIWIKAVREVVEEDQREMWIPKARLEGYVSKEKPTIVTIGPGKYHDRALKIQSDIIHKDKCRALPQARWNKEEKVWEAPAASPVLLDFLTEFEAVEFEVSDEAMQLIEAQPPEQPTGELPDIPLTKTDPWLGQKRAFWFAKDRPGVMLPLKVGSGKSKITIDLISNSDAKRVLILAPRFVVKGWGEQFALHSPLEWDVLTLGHGAVKKKANDLMDKLESNPDRLVVVMNYESAWRPPIGPWVTQGGEKHSLFSYSHRQLKDAKGHGAQTYSGVLGTVDWDVVVCDESHRIKNPSSKQGRMAIFLRDCAEQRIALTGTPMGQSPLDVFGQYAFLDPAVFGDNYYAFRNKYAVMGGYEDRQIVGVQNKEELNRKFWSIAYRPQPDEALDLPELQHVTRSFGLGGKAQKVYADLYENMVTDMQDGTLTPANAAVRMLRLQQVSSGFARLDKDDKPIGDKDEEKRGRTVRVDDCKQEALKDFLMDLDPDEPVVVFSWFHEDMDIVHETAESLGRGSGEMSGRGRDDREAWKDREFPILAVQIQAGAEGVNDLVHARYGVYYSTGHSLTKYEQSIGRLHRPGQRHNVTMVHLIAEGFEGVDSDGKARYYSSADEVVYRGLSEKKKLIDVVKEMK